MNDEIDRELIAAHYAVREAERQLERATEHRALAFALANEKGRTSGDVARATGATPHQVLYAIRVGHSLISRRRRRFERAQGVAA